MISREEVRWAYRMFLGREPETPEAVEGFLDATDLDDLRRRFMASGEFLSKQKGRPEVGRYLDSTDIDVQVDCSPSDLRRMLDGISKEWVGFGERDPHWSVIVDDDFLMRNIDENEDRFYQSGRADIGWVLSTIRRNRPNASFRNALDFGCGVGRLTLALAEHAEKATGIDISPPHLVWARKRAAETEIDNTHFKSISSIEDVEAERGFDLIISLIVLQHNPPPIMAKLFRALLQALSVGGIAVIQMPTYISGQSFSVDRYFSMKQASMEMNFLPQPAIFDIIESSGCRVLEVREDGTMGAFPGLSHIFVVERRI